MDKSRFANHRIYLPIDMYGILQYQAHKIFCSLAHEGLLVHYIWHDFSKIAVFFKVTLEGGGGGGGGGKKKSYRHHPKSS